MKHLPNSLEELLPADLLLEDLPYSKLQKDAEIMSMFWEDIHNKEVLKVAPDTSGADRFFVDEFINEEMSFDFWVIARDFLQHHYPRLKEFHDMAENCVDVPEKRNLEMVLQKRILSMIYNAAKSGDEYCVLFVKFYASTFFTLFVPIIHKFFIIMRIPCSQFFKLFSTSRNQLYTQFQDRYHFKSCTEIYSQISNK